MHRSHTSLPFAIAALALGACDHHAFDPSDAVIPMDAVVVPDEPFVCPAVTLDAGALIPDPPGARQLVFVIDSLRTTPPVPADLDTSMVGYGFDLDGILTAPGAGIVGPTPGCGQPDLLSVLDPDQNSTERESHDCHAGSPCRYDAPGCIGGVDNQLPSLLLLFSSIVLEFDRQVQASLDSDIAGNRYSVIVVLSGVGNAPADLQNDPDITASLFIGRPTFNTDCASVLPGREYALSEQFLRGGSDPTANAILRLPGRIVNGRVDAMGSGEDALPFPLTLAGYGLEFPLRRLHLRFDLASRNGTLPAAANGNLGGTMYGRDFLDAFAHDPQVAMYYSLFPSIIGQIIDIDINNVCNNEQNANPALYGGISVGLGFTLVPATLSPTPVSAPIPGTCGTQSLPDAGSPRD